MKQVPIAIIPARGGSKGIIRKNVYPIHGLPLVCFSIKAALNSGIKELETFVSTEDDEIASISREHGARIINRPEELAADTTSTEDVIKHAIQDCAREGISACEILLLQPTSPLRNSSDISSAYRLFKDSGADSLVSASYDHGLFWSGAPDSPVPEYNFRNRPRRQEMEARYRENGAIYITKPEIYYKYNNRLGGKIVLFLMDPLTSIDIDEHSDIHIAKCLLTHTRKIG